ncbi:hypothetical protein KBK19_08210 [Microvirga sp. STR05]|uniref:DUF7033 domain-containing protein n=1 Tax=Hymenobacter duratus TaxID=2771356 RepID=A0ABR8JHZ7_9BACT|nr:hypothetical protein [Hymenobacter duratus]MBD2715015.1 hypothetical protein [Hymenobacter duratus]MBR7949921.1 hypothetical protein [Microvirga sp. STR05]
MLPPLPPVVATTPESRLAYVLHHFWQAYNGRPEVTIGYAATQPQVEMAEAAGTFFSETNPYPAAPGWRDWHGQRLPFFFDPHPDKPLLELLPAGRARINADVVSAAFYLLSGWQEFFSDERDQHDRFPFAASVQHRYGFVAVPVVNYYFDVLKTAVEHATGQPMPPRRWAGGAPFATFVTHDIDSLHGAWKAPAKAALRRHDWLSFGRQLLQHFTQPDTWDNLELVQRTVAEFGAKSTFFFLPEHQKDANGTPNADYLAATVRQRATQLVKTGSELAVHGSIGTCVDARKLRKQRARIPGKVLGNRFHYLYWEPRLTSAVLTEAGIAYDSTLGFAEHYGFRNSYCLPFQPFDFQTGKPCDFLEIPLNVMDATLHHPNYLQLAPDEILPALTPMFREIERFGGVCTLLWHNDHFDPANERTGPRQFAELMQYLRSRNTAFVNGQDVVDWCSAGLVD